MNRVELEAAIKETRMMMQGQKATRESYDSLSSTMIGLRKELSKLDKADASRGAATTQNFMNGLSKDQQKAFTEARNAPWYSRLSDKELLQNLIDRGVVSRTKPGESAGDKAIKQLAKMKAEQQAWNDQVAAGQEGNEGGEGDDGE